MIQSPVQKKKVQLPVPNQQSTPIAEKKVKESDTSMVESGLQNLNTRFADIIDRNSAMMAENQQLKDEINTIEDAKTAELAKIKEMYEAELKEARRLLDNESVKAAQRDIETNKLRESNKELNERATTLKLSEAEARKLAESLQAELDELRAESATNRRKTQDMENQKAELLMQLNAAKSDADLLKTKSDEQQLSITQRDNALQSKQEEHEMTLRVLNQELSAARKDQASALQKSMQADQTHNATMANAIDDIRAEHAESLKEAEQKIKAQFAKKISDLEGKISRGQRLLSEQRDKATKNKALADQAKSNADRLERELQKAKARAMDLEANLASQKAMADEQIKELEESVAEWKAKCEKAEATLRAGKDQYATLFKEVETYRNLLEIEESRLNITPSPIREKRARGEKRRMTSSSAEAPGTKKSKSADNSAENGALEVSEIGTHGDGAQNGDASCAIM